MPRLPLSPTLARNRVAALSRSRTEDDPGYQEARRDLAFANLVRETRSFLAAAPVPFTDAQCDYLTELIRSTS